MNEDLHRPDLSDRIAFLRAFVRSPRQVGSVVPSSRFLERRLVSLSAVANARTIVELGPGTGGTTRAILRAMSQQARLLCIEIDPDLHGLLRRIDDPRLIAHLGSAEQLPEILSTHGLSKPEVVISGIPFYTMEHAVARRILDGLAAVLPYGGYFVAYQFRDRVAQLCGPPLELTSVELELLNVPPMRVFRWQKNGVRADHA
ncbi:MAG TPA: methyltransferase type 12 [Burkholderiales bacterium]|jgi:phospholipid N-methyltransferase